MKHQNKLEQLAYLAIIDSHFISWAPPDPCFAYDCNTGQASRKISATILRLLLVVIISLAIDDIILTALLSSLLLSSKLNMVL